MRYTVENERDLPDPPMTMVNPWCYYLRLMSDPTLMIHSHSGDIYRRADGAPWESPVVSIALNSRTGKMERTYAWKSKAA